MSTEPDGQRDRQHQQGNQRDRMQRGDQRLGQRPARQHDVFLHRVGRRPGDQAKDRQQGDLDARGQAAQQVGRQPDAGLQLIFDGDGSGQPGRCLQGPGLRVTLTRRQPARFGRRARVTIQRLSVAGRRHARCVLGWPPPCQSHLEIVSSARLAARTTLLAVCRMVQSMASVTIAAVRAEAAVLADVAAGLTDTDLALPTGCPPWRVADLLAHVIIAVRRIDQAIAEPEDVPGQDALVTAAGYYRPDHRFSAVVNADRIASAQLLAARLGSAAAIAAEIDA